MSDHQKQHEFHCHQQLWNLVQNHWEPNSIFGHGVDHAYRAYRLGNLICDQEGGDFLIVGAACYLMDSGLDVKQGRQGHKERSVNIAKSVIPFVSDLIPCHEIIITSIMYHDADDEFPQETPKEVKIVRDCDTLDRMGFTGIRMTLKYGEWVGRRLYNAKDPTCLSNAPELDAYTIDYIKFLYTLRDWLSTESALKIGNRKILELDCFMNSFLSLTNCEPPDYSRTMQLVTSLEGQMGNPYGKTI